MSEPDNDRDWWLFYTSMSREQMSARIAETLRGNPSKHFLNALADLFEPSVKKRNYKATVSRTKVGRARSLSNEIGRELAILIDETNNVEAAIASMREKYGVSRAKCFEALRHEREMRELDAMMAAYSSTPPEVQKT